MPCSTRDRSDKCRRSFSRVRRKGQGIAPRSSSGVLVLVTDGYGPLIELSIWRLSADSHFSTQSLSQSLLASPPFIGHVGCLRTRGSDEHSFHEFSPFGAALGLRYNRRRLSSSSLFASEAAGNSTAAASKAAATKPAGVVRTAALTDTALPIARSNVAFISSGCGAAVSDWDSVSGRRLMLAVIGICFPYCRAFRSAASLRMTG